MYVIETALLRNRGVKYSRTQLLCGLNRLDGFKHDACSSVFIKYVLGAYVSRLSPTEHLPNTAAVRQNMTDTVPSFLVLCGLLQTV